MPALRPLCIFAVAAACMAAGTASAEPVKIAVLETLSGPQAASGLMYRAAARYAVERMNAEGGWNGEPVGHYIAHAFNPEAAGVDGERFVADYRARTGHVPTFIEPQTVFGLAMVADALKRVKPEGGRLNVNALAAAIETTQIRTPMGEMSMRAADHQALLPMVVSTVAKDAKFKADGTDMGFKPVKVFAAAEAAAPAQASCRMRRPS